MDGGNNDIYGSLGNLFDPLQCPFDAVPQVRMAPAGYPPVEGAVPPVMMVAPAGNMPVQGAVPLEVMAAPAGGEVPVVRAVPVSVVPPTVTAGESGQGTGGADTSGRKKRGRPRKYDDQGKLIAPSGAATAAAAGPSRSGKKGRGRAAGSGNLQSPIPSQSGEEANLSVSMVGWGFTPHLINVEIGEDVAAKIATFAVRNGPKGICVLSASGTVSNVLISQLGVSGGIERYEGLFKIIALSGSFSAADSGIRRGRAGGLSVALAGADGRIIGGSLAGALVASCPIQVIVGTFLSSDWQNRKGKSPLQEPASATPSAPGPSRAGAAPTPPVNPGANIFASPMQAAHVLNPGANLYSSVPTQPGHLASNMRTMSVDGAGLNNPAHPTVQRSPPADMDPQSSFRRG